MQLCTHILRVSLFLSLPPSLTHSPSISVSLSHADSRAQQIHIYVCVYIRCIHTRRPSPARMASLIHVYSENVSENIETMIAAILTTSNTLTPMLTCLCVPLIFPAHQATFLLASHAQQP